MWKPALILTVGVIVALGLALRARNHADDVTRRFANDIPWTLVRVDAGGRRLVLRYPTTLGPDVRARLAKPSIDATPRTVTITLTELLRTSGKGKTGVYFDTRETTVELREPLNGRRVRVGNVDDGLDVYREVLQSAKREATKRAGPRS